LVRLTKHTLKAHMRSSLSSGKPKTFKAILYNTVAFLVFLLLSVHSFAQKVSSDLRYAAYKDATVYVQENDSTQLPADVLKKGTFVSLNGRSPVFNPSVKNVWMKFNVTNALHHDTLYLDVNYTHLSKLSLYEVVGDSTKLIDEKGNSLAYVPNGYSSSSYIFKVPFAKQENKQFLLHVNSEHPIIVPAYIETEDAARNQGLIQTFITALYLGVLLVIFLYNLFLFFVTRDRTYLIYVAYIFFLCIAQLTAAGQGYSALWRDLPQLNRYAVIWSSSLSIMLAIVFAGAFLQTKKNTPILHKILIGVFVLYVLGLINSLFGPLSVSYAVLNYVTIVAVIVVYIASVYIAKTGYKPALFYLLAWTALLLSLLILVLRNLNALPYNSFTTYITYLGSAIEAVLLSIALGDRINVLRNEKEASQREALKALEENQKLVQQQNIMLEQKVAERTEELETALTDLKDAQAQLVSAEKMASLGQLTAGIAHEINNPINFVKSNIKPLQLDIKDLIEVIDEYETLHTADDATLKKKLKEIDELRKQIDVGFVKQELHSLIKGIEDGAERTAEIVRGLRTFSRLDESEVKTVNVHDGLDSTLVLLKNSMPHNLKVNRDYRSTGNIECLPGKLNQVFMNILNNAIQAIAEKGSTEDEFITITTFDIEDKIEIHIKDSGPGMPEDVKNRIFEPFFTTKDVGAGTGLGLAIVYKIIEQHHGKIDVISNIGAGTEFIITLPKALPENQILP
jgi:two-component system NtrC family sensor kinase